MSIILNIKIDIYIYIYISFNISYKPVAERKQCKMASDENKGGTLKLSAGNFVEFVELLRQLTENSNPMIAIQITGGWFTNQMLGVLMQSMQSYTRQKIKLCFRSCKTITANGVAHLAELKALWSLDLSFCMIADDSLACLTGLTSLKYLYLKWCRKIKGDGLVHMAALSSLLHLDLNGCNAIMDDSIVHLAGHPSMQTLDIGWCKKLTNVAVSHLAGLMSLQGLDLSGCDLITNDGVRHLARLPSLQSLSLYACFAITNDCVGYLKQLVYLRCLDVKYCKITGDCITDLVMVLPTLVISQ